MQLQLEPEMQLPDGIIFPSLPTCPGVQVGMHFRAAVGKVFPKNPFSRGAAAEG